jgi:hypothetical protein
MTGRENQVCLINEGQVPFCLDPDTGGWYGQTGYEGNVVNGDYWTPSGEEGNTLEGPCPGSQYRESNGGCELVPAEEQQASSGPASTSATVTDDSMPSATGLNPTGGDSSSPNAAAPTAVQEVAAGLIVGAIALGLL